MRAIRLVSAGTAAAVLLLGSSTVVLGQEEVADEGPRYFYGEMVDGIFHPDEDNPLGCDIGMTSDVTYFGESTLLGPTTVRQINCYVPTETLLNVQGVAITFAGESGDTLTGTGSGDCIPDDVPEPKAVELVVPLRCIRLHQGKPIQKHLFLLLGQAECVVPNVE